MPSTPPDSDALQATPQSIADRWALVSARDIMRTDVITIPYSTPLSEVEHILSDNKISGAPVTDETGHIIGIVSIRDIIERYAEDPDARPRRGGGFYQMQCDEMIEEEYESFQIPEETEEVARDVMTGTVYDVPVTAGLKTIAAMMTKYKIHRVLVQENGRHVGLISTMEILNALNA